MELKEVKIKYQEKLDQGDLISKYHIRYEVYLSYRGKTLITDYQCNKRVEPTKEDVLSCLLLDTISYDSCNDIDDFQSSFGYEKVSECIKVYNGCKKSSERMHEMFSEDELEELNSLINC